MDTRSAAHSSSIDLPEERQLAKSLSSSAEAVRAATRRRFTLAYKRTIANDPKDDLNDDELLNRVPQWTFALRWYGEAYKI